ncbi:hypothetical protein WN943_006847 [Citrus x changshan-huyou]
MKRQSPRKKKESQMKPHKKPRMTFEIPGDKPCSPKKKTSPKKPQEKPLSRRRIRNYHTVHMNQVLGIVIFGNLCEKNLAQMGYYVPYQLDEDHLGSYTQDSYHQPMIRMPLLQG